MKALYLFLAFCFASTAMAFEDHKELISTNKTQQYKCKRCKGTGEEPLIFNCDNCGGRKYKERIVNCGTCGGEKVVRNEYGESRICLTCDGAGKRIERSECGKCGGSGTMKKPCRNCGGTGEQSLQ